MIQIEAVQIAAWTRRSVTVTVVVVVVILMVVYLVWTQNAAVYQGSSGACCRLVTSSAGVCIVSVAVIVSSIVFGCNTIFNHSHYILL